MFIVLSNESFEVTDRFHGAFETQEIAEGFIKSAYDRGITLGTYTFVKEITFLNGFGCNKTLSGFLVDWDGRATERTDTEFFL